MGAFVAGTVGVAAVLVAGLIAFATRTLFEAEPFADRVAASLSDPRVASFVAARVTDELLAQQPDLTGFRPIVLVATESLVASPAIRAIVRRGALRAHDLVMSGGTEGVLLSIDDAGVLLRSALATRPELADKIPSDATAVVARLGESQALKTGAALLRLGPRLRMAGVAVFLLGALLVLGSVVLARDRRLALLANGVALVAVAAVILLLIRLGGSALARLTNDPALGEALHGFWDSFAQGLVPRALAIAGVGILFAAAAASLLERVQLMALVRSTFDWLSRSHERRGAVLLRSIALVLIGGLAVLRPGLVIDALVIGAGVVVLFVGLEELFRLVIPALPARMGGPAEAAAGRRASRLGLAAGATAMIILAVGAGAAIVGRSETTAVPLAAAITHCNGYAELCDRPLNHVVFAGTHNAMGAAEIADWMFPNQDRRIPAQLRDGIRALMLDVHGGIPVGGRVKTDMGDEGAQREKYEAVVGAEGMDAVLRIRNRLVGGNEGPRGLYVCHGFCELGAEPLVPVLREVREFLIASPHEVIIMILEDPGATAEQIDSAFGAAGLLELVYRGAATPPWRTLREMIAADERVLVLSENAWPGVAWYHPAFEVVQETPYTFTDPSEFTCRPNRGGQSGSLLVVNHWIETTPAPLPSSAEQVNAYEPLLARARQCQRERGMLPNIVAVDFYRRGDVIGVARTLNRVPQPAGGPD